MINRGSLELINIDAFQQKSNSKWNCAVVNIRSLNYELVVRSIRPTISFKSILRSPAFIRIWSRNFGQDTSRRIFLLPNDFEDNKHITFSITSVSVSRKGSNFSDAIFDFLWISEWCFLLEPENSVWETSSSWRNLVANLYSYTVLQT